MGFSQGGERPSCNASVKTVQTGGSTMADYTADAVVVAVPLGVLQANAVTFSPSLPASYTAAIARMQFGVVNKAVAVFDTDFWSAGCNNELMLAINKQNAGIDSRGMFPYFMNTNRNWKGTNALQLGGMPLLLNRRQMQKCRPISCPESVSNFQVLPTRHDSFEQSGARTHLQREVIPLRLASTPK
ncbi:unnamed protein product [Durusdinium trenchii]